MAQPHRLHSGSDSNNQRGQNKSDYNRCGRTFPAWHVLSYDSGAANFRGCRGLGCDGKAILIDDFAGFSIYGTHIQFAPHDTSNRMASNVLPENYMGA
jgi:hypothetical protein